MKTHRCAYCGQTFSVEDNRIRKYCPDKDCRRLADKQRRINRKEKRREEINTAFDVWRMSAHGRKMLAAVESEKTIFAQIWRPTHIDYRAIVGMLRMKYNYHIPNNYVRCIKDFIERRDMP